jgi:hypothetical protein
MENYDCSLECAGDFIKNSQKLVKIAVALNYDEFKYAGESIKNNE